MGDVDLVLSMGWISHLDDLWEEPRLARFVTRLASFARVILYDKRGTGLSDPVSPAELPTLDQRMDDVRAVMDAAGSERAALFGVSEGGPICTLFAATYPRRTVALIIFGGYARRQWAGDYPSAPTPTEHQEFFERIEREWGGVVDLSTLLPSVADDEEFRAWWAAYLRRGASPRAAVALARMNAQIDIRQILPAVRVPTLVLHRAGDMTVPVENGRYLAERIADARYVELAGADHLPFAGDQDAVLDEVEFFLTGIRPAPEPDRVLATVLVTEIVGAAEIAAHLGDLRWSEVRAAHRALVHEELRRFRGREVSLMLEGSLATFDAPAPAIRCAEAIVAGARRLGLSARAGLHTGEVQVLGDDVAGVAVHLAARVAAHGAAGEVLFSNTVRDLIAGEGIELEPVGNRVFPGLPGEWRLFRVARVGGLAVAAPGLPGPAEAVTGSRSPASLSRREREIAGRLALGLSNRQIADELSISVATVERHVANILAKLDFRSRAQVAAWAVEQGLLRTSSV